MNHIKGGQGRGSDEIEHDAVVWAACVTLGAVLILAAIVGGW